VGGELTGRLVHALEGLVVAGLLAAVFFLVALVVRWVIGKEIGSKRYYGAAIAGGFILYGALISTLPPKQTTSVQGGTPINQSTGGLDAPFLAPNDEHLEQFPIQLEQAMERLPDQQRAEITDAIAFLSFGVAANLAEQDPTKFRAASDSDLRAKAFLHLYRHAQDQGGSMTLRKFVELSEELKRQKPEWWAKYVQAKSAPSAP
jgi:hypothetical protein